MNFGELKDLTAYYLDDLNFGYFTTTQVGRFLNNAQYEVQKMLIGAHENWYFKCVETDTIDGQADYILPEDFLKLIRLEVVIDSSANTVQMLQPITINQQGLYPNQDGQPLVYYIRKNRVVLLPTPDTAYTLRLSYAYLVTEMTQDSNTPDIPAQYHELLAVMAARDGRIKDDRDANPLLERKFQMYVDMLKSDADDRNVDVPRSIVVTEDLGSFTGYF